MSSAHSPEWDWVAYAAAFGRRLKALRRSCGLSQIALAERAGVTPNNVKLLELGRSSEDRPANPSLRTVYRLAEALGVAPAELLPSASDIPAALPREAHATFSWSDVGVPQQVRPPDR